MVFLCCWMPDCYEFSFYTPCAPPPPPQTKDAEGYIVFIFPFEHSSVTLVEFTTKFYDKGSQMGISQQPLIRRHSDLGHGYLGGSAYIP